MKKVFAALVTVVLLAGLVVPASAALPGPGWWTSFQIQNVDTGNATISFTAYWQVGGSGGDTTYSEDGSITLAQGAAVIYNPGLAPTYPSGNRIGFNTTDKHLPTGFAGGVEVQSDKAIRAVVNVGNNPAGSVGITGGRASAFYQGTQGEDVGTSISFPVMKHNYFGQTTSFYVQAAGGPATIVATFATATCGSGTPTGTYPVTAVNIAAGKTYLLDPAAASVPTGCLGSLQVTATSGNIAGVIVETQHSANPGTFALATKGFGADDADTTIVAPTNKVGFYGGSTGWQILNPGATAATAVVTFTVTAVAPGSAAETAGIAIGDQYRANVNIPAGGSYLFSQGNGNYLAASPLDGAPAMAAGIFFAGTAVASQPVVATINEANGGNRIVYSAFPGKYATTSVAAPLVKEDFYGATTSVAVQNVGTADATVTLQYVCSGDGAGTYNIPAQTIAPNSAKNFVDMNNTTRWGSELVKSAAQCAVSVTSTNGQPIVAVAQESNPSVDTKNYEGFNLD